MRKIILLFVVFGFLSCKDKEDKTLSSKKSNIVIESILDSTNHDYGIVKIPKASANIDCGSPEFALILQLIDVNGNIDYETQLWWLRNFGNFVCNNDYYNCVIDYHIFKGENSEKDFEDAAKLHPENSSGNIVYYNISAAEIKSFIEKEEFNKCYQYHVKFNLIKDTVNKVLPEKGVFDPKLSYYSIPLLKGIILNLEKNLNDLSTVKFEFCNAKINGEDKIIFKVQDIKSVLFYNFSQDPKSMPIFVF